MKFEFSAGFIVFYKDVEPLYLLLHYGSKDKPGHWDFPKGHIEKGEKAIAAAIRELKEETGIEDINVIEGFKDVLVYFFMEKTEEGKKERVKKSVTYFVGEAKTKDVSLSWEHIGYAWLPYADALKQLTFESSRGVLERAHNFIIEKVYGKR